MAAPRRQWLRIVLIIVAVLLVLIGLLGFGVWYYLFREEETAYGPG